MVRFIFFGLDFVPPCPRPSARVLRLLVYIESDILPSRRTSELVFFFWHDVILVCPTAQFFCFRSSEPQTSHQHDFYFWYFIHSSFSYLSFLFFFNFVGWALFFTTSNHSKKKKRKRTAILEKRFFFFIFLFGLQTIVLSMNYHSILTILYFFIL